MSLRWSDRYAADNAPGLEVRAGFSEEDLLKSQRSAEIGSARELAEEWKLAVIAKGCQDLPPDGERDG